MSAALAVTEALRADVADTDHLYCCDPDRAICGVDLSAADEVEDLPNLCVVCDDLDALPCPHCGWEPE